MKIFIILIFLLCAISAEAQTYYAGGGLTTNCTTMQTSTTPSTTIKAALDCIGTAAGAGAGKTIIVKPGTYSENLDEAFIGQWLPRGSVGNPFILKAENRAVLRNSDGTLSAGTNKTILRRNGFLMRVYAGDAYGVNYYTIIDGFDFDISLSTGTDGGIALQSAVSAPNFITIQYSDFHDSNRPMMLQTGNHSDSNPNGNNLYFYYNRFHDGTFDQTGGGGGNFAYPVYVGGGYNGKFIGNEFYNFPSFGLHFNDQPSGVADQVQGQRIDNWEIAGNYFHNWSTYNGGSGGTGGANAAAIVFFNSGLTPSGASGVGSVTYNNIFKDGPDAIRLQGNAHLHKFSNNTLYHMTGNLSSDSGSAVEIMADTIAKNNIFSGGTVQPYLGGYHSYDFSFNSTNMVNNFCTNAGPGCSVMGDPLFASGSGAAAFKLQSSSTANNTGLNLGSTYATDFAGLPRPASGPWEMGAYEFGAPPITCPAVTPALVASYNFEGNGNDATGNGRTATLGSGWTYTTGHTGQGALSDGTSGITVADHDSLDPCAAFTYEGWISLANTSGDYVFIVKNPDSKAALFASISGYCGSGAIAGGYFEGSSHAACYSGSLSPGFKHIALTYDANLSSANIKLYLDGVLINTANGTDLLSATTGTLQFCSSGYGEICPSGTVIDDIRIYNYARSASEILSSITPPPVFTIKLDVSSLKIGPSVSLKVGVP